MARGLFAITLALACVTASAEELPPSHGTRAPRRAPESELIGSRHAAIVPEETKADRAPEPRARFGGPLPPRTRDASMIRCRENSCEAHDGRGRAARNGKR